MNTLQFRFRISDAWGAEYNVWHNRTEYCIHHVGSPRMKQESHAKLMGHAAYFVQDITPADAIYLAQQFNEWRKAEHARAVDEITRKHGADVAADVAAEPPTPVESVWWIQPPAGWQHADVAAAVAA